MVRRAIIALSASGAMLAFQPAAGASGFDGITVIEFADEAGRNAIIGRRAMGPASVAAHLVSFVSAKGSYAALLSRWGERLCIAWAPENNYIGQSITFGIPASVAGMKASPDICQPFTLTYESGGSVRVEARNKFHKDEGPLGEAASVVSYGGSHRVLARVPLMPLDWGQRVFEAHAVKGVRLGPLPAVGAALAGQPVEISVGKLEREMIFRKDFEAVVEGPLAGSGKVRVGGYVAAREILGWPWDTLYAVWLQEGIPPVSPDTFEEAAAQRYGNASTRYLTDAGQFQLVWAYDLAGRKLTASGAEPDPKGERFLTEAAKPDNCLALGADRWLGRAGLPSIVNQDIGPWGCALIMTLTYRGGGQAVDGYRIEMVSGYTLALDHFFTRLEELREVRETIEKLESRKPKL